MSDQSMHGLIVARIKKLKAELTVYELALAQLEHLDKPVVLDTIVVKPKRNKGLIDAIRVVLATGELFHIDELRMRAAELTGVPAPVSSTHAALKKLRIEGYLEADGKGHYLANKVDGVAQTEASLPVPAPEPTDKRKLFTRGPTHVRGDDVMKVIGHTSLNLDAIHKALMKNTSKSITKSSVKAHIDRLIARERLITDKNGRFRAI